MDKNTYIEKTKHSHSEKSYLTLKIDSNALEDITLKMSILSSDNCMKILMIIIDKPSKKIYDSTEVCNKLKENYGVSISKQATRKHLENLVFLDIIKRTEAVIERKRGKRTVISYEAISDSLSKLSLIVSSLDKKQINFDQYIVGNKTCLTILNGKYKNKCFKLDKDEHIIGRIGDMDFESMKYENDIILPNDYKSVTRINKPHGIFNFENGIWYFTDKGSTNQSYINIRKINENNPIKLKNKDIIQLGSGPHCVYMLFSTKYN
ncbi:FHA domain-containing protein [Methanobrevibacter sp. DSM 116169]|uniref:FHA domain-containing protein n=1 Tax=Methanobrevibacter sp. DSM 116169 TaxID=3242727 RepID=UPI0038FD27F7